MKRLSNSFAACTIIAKNYLPMARVLAESWKKFHPESPFFVLLLDSPEGFFAPASEQFLTVLTPELDIPNLPGFLFKYSILEASTAVKPYFLGYLFQRYSIEKLLYLDPDIQIFASLEGLNTALDDSNILLIPHLTFPTPPDGLKPDDHDILQAGTYNLGFLGLRSGKTSDTLLEWWCKKLHHHCVVAFERNLFVDQRWMDLVPGLFDRVRIWRDPGYDVAYWNLHERQVTIESEQVSVNGRPLVFFHYSGFNPDEPRNISKHQNRFRHMGDIGDAKDLYSQYRRLLIGKGWEDCKAWKYDHNFFDNGLAVPPAARQYYWNLGPNIAHLGDPFTWMDGSNASFSSSENARVAARRRFGVNVLGYLNSEKGVGEGVRSNLRIVNAGRLPFVANKIVDSGSHNIESLQHAVVAENPYAINLITVNADQFSNFARNQQSYLRGHYNIGYWAWEMPEFPPEWNESFQYADEIWTPSVFTRDSVASATRLPVLTIHHSIDLDLDLDPTVDRSMFGIESDTYVFLFFFDFHSFLERKNPIGLIRAFKNAFGSRRDVQLLIKSLHSAEHKEELRALQEMAQGANIRILDGVLSRAERQALMMACDCYVSLHRSEGFGLTMAETMLCGKPVIATGYSGNVDFMTPETSYLVPYKLITLDRTHGPYRAGFHWAQPDLDYATDVMRRVEEDRAASQHVGARARESVRTLLHPATIARPVLQHFQDLGFGNLGDDFAWLDLPASSSTVPADTQVTILAPQRETTAFSG